MRKVLKKSLALLLALTMVFGAAPLAGLVGLELPSLKDVFADKAEAISQNNVFNEKFCEYENHYYSVENGKIYRYSLDLSKKEEFMSTHSFYTLSVYNNILYAGGSLDKSSYEIISYNDSSEKKDVVYKTGNSLKSLYFYNNMLFFYDNGVVCSVDLETYETNYIFDCNSKYYSCPLYFYNNELFFNGANTFYCYKLYSGDVTALCDGRIIDLIENELYYEKSDDDNGILKVGQINLSTNQNTIFFTTNYDKSSSSLAKPNVYDLEISKNKIYFTVGYLRGSGGYYYGDLYYSNKGSSNSVLIKEETGSELYCINNDLFITLGSDIYSGIYGLAKIENNKIIVISDRLFFIDDCYSGRVVNHTDGGLSVYDIKTNRNFKITDDEMYINRYEDKVNETIARYLNEYGIKITKEHFGIYYEILGYSDGILAFNPCLVIPNGMVFNRGERIFTGDTEVINTNNNSKIFQEKSYIADIWLNQHFGVYDTMESEMIENILDYTALSSIIYNDLKDNPAFNEAHLTWKILQVAFDGVKALEEGISKDELYETLIFDMLRKVMLEKEEETGNIILDSVSKGGNITKKVTKYKNAIDDFANITEGTSSVLLDVLKTWEFDPKSDSFQKFYASLNNANDISKRWNDSGFVKNVGKIAKISKSVTDFYERFTGYALALDMSEEMITLLKEMKSNTEVFEFKYALQNVINAYKNADYAAFVCTLELSEDLTINFMDKMFEEVSSKSKVYSALRGVYKTGVAFIDLTMNTSKIIDSYYLCEATYNFVSANKASINALAQKYISSGLETDAGAYVYAMRVYEQVYTIDCETAINFAKNASEEGLINLTKKIGRTIVNFITGSDKESSYESMINSKKMILACLDSMFYELDNAWKFDQDYLKHDYPDIYSIYVKNELIKEEYTPGIVDAFIGQDGYTNIFWNLPCYFYAKDGTLKILYGTRAIDGIHITERTGSYYGTNEYTLEKIQSPILSFNESTFSIFNKNYSISAYSETSGGKVYTKSTSVEIENPLKTVKVGLPCIRDRFGSNISSSSTMTISITDDTPLFYNNVMYKIYRKSDNSSWKLIDVIPRRSDGFYNNITVYEDKSAVTGEKYSYKVSSYLEFNNGKKLYSEESDVFSAIKSSDVFDKKTLNIEKVIPNNSFKSKTSSQAVLDNNSPYVKLSWSAIDNAEKYEIYRIADYGTIYKRIATLNKSVLSYFDYDLDNKITYDYVVVPIIESIDGSPTYDISTCSQGEIDYDLGEIYTITWITEDRTTTQRYRAGEEIKLPDTSKENCVFIGWSPSVPKYMPSYDMEFFGEYEKLNENTDTSDNILNVSIKYPSTSTITFGDSIILHLNIDRPLPDGAYIEWSESNGNFDMSVSADGTTCKISPKSNGKTVFTATVYDKDGNVISSDTQEMTAKAGLWQKIVAFFKKIFGLTKTIPEAFKGIL